MNSMLERGLLHIVGNSTLPGMAPAVVLVPMLNLGHAPDMLQLAAMLAGSTTPSHRPETSGGQPIQSQSHINTHSATRVVVLSVVEVPASEPLTMGLDMARSYRALLDFLPSEVEAGGRQVRVDRMVKVARDVSMAIHQAAYEERADMVLLYWKGYAREPKRRLYGRIIDATLRNPPCSVMLARLEGWSHSRRIFLPVRGGPSAEQALHIGVSLAERMGLPMAVMHNVPLSDDRHPTAGGPMMTADARLEDESEARLEDYAGDESQVEALGEEPYIIFNEHLREVRAQASVPVESIITRQPDPVEALLDEARGDDILIMGLPAITGERDPAAHEAAVESSIALRVSKVKGPPLLLLNTPISIDLAGYKRKMRASRSKKRWVDMPFEHWFVEHTYHSDEFKDPEEFLRAKRASGLTLSIVLLTSNDHKQVYSALTGLKRVLTDLYPIADQIVVVDAGSSDNTVDVARDMGVEVYSAGEILPAQGDLHGRGESWWKSLAVAHGDLVVWLDPRARRFHPSTAISLVGPLLKHSTLQMVKAFGHTDTPDGPRHTERVERAERGGVREDHFSPVDMSWGGFVVPRRDGSVFSEQVRVQALKPSDLLSLSVSQIAMLPPRTLVQVLSPSLAGVIAPFGRDMAARREAMLSLPAFAGDNLELGLLLSIAAQFGTNGIAQVELRQAHPASPPPPGVRSAIDILQAMSRRLQDPSTRRCATELANRLHKELEGRRAPSPATGASDLVASLFEVRALAPVERPPMGRLLGE